MLKTAKYKKNCLLISVDPGKKGAIVCSTFDGEKLIPKNAASFDSCCDILDAATLISSFVSKARRELGNDEIGTLYIVERPLPNPLCARKSISTQFAIYGSILLALKQLSKNNVLEIDPKTWVSAVCTKEERKLKKEGRIFACERIFGSEIKKILKLKNKIHDGIADAILMSEFIANKLFKNKE